MSRCLPFLEHFQHLEETETLLVESIQKDEQLCLRIISTSMCTWKLQDRSPLRIIEFKIQLRALFCVHRSGRRWRMLNLITHSVVKVQTRIILHLVIYIQWQSPVLMQEIMCWAENQGPVFCRYMLPIEMCNLTVLYSWPTILVSVSTAINLYTFLTVSKILKFFCHLLTWLHVD